MSARAFSSRLSVTMISGRSSWLSYEVLYSSIVMSVNWNGCRLLKRISLTSFCSLLKFSTWLLVMALVVDPSINLLRLPMSSISESYMSLLILESWCIRNVAAATNSHQWLLKSSRNSLLSLLTIWSSYFIAIFKLSGNSYPGRRLLNLLMSWSVTLLILFTGTRSRLMYALMVALPSLSDFFISSINYHICGWELLFRWVSLKKKIIRRNVNVWHTQSLWSFGRQLTKIVHSSNSK